MIRSKTKEARLSLVPTRADMPELAGPQLAGRDWNAPVLNDPDCKGGQG
jgi:hypothetical protein